MGDLLARRMASLHRAALVISVAALLVASGCLTTGVDTRVADDGTVDRYRITLDVPSTLYERLNRSAREDDSTVRQEFLEGYNRSNYEDVGVAVDPPEVGGDARITVTLEGFDPDDLEPSGLGDRRDAAGDPQAIVPDIEVREEGDRLVYVDRTFHNGSVNGSEEAPEELEDGGIELHYRLEMPGLLVEERTNADRIDGDRAVWNASGPTATTNTTVRAVSRHNVAPDAAFAANRTDVDPNGSVRFDAANASDPDGDRLTYAWDFDGDGETDATGRQVTHRFAETGNHEVTLTVTDDDGAADTAATRIAVGSTGQALPGFGGVVALLALLAAVGGLAVRRR